MKSVRLTIATCASLLLFVLSPLVQATQVISECDSPNEGVSSECLRTKTAVASKEIGVVLEAHRLTLKKRTHSAIADEKVAGPEIERRLTASQSAWEAYLAADCTLQMSEFYGGSYAPLLYHSCLLDKTEARLNFLKTAQF